MGETRITSMPGSPCIPPLHPRAERNSADNTITWHEDIVLSSEHTGTRKTSEPEGFTKSASLLGLANPQFVATGKMTVILDGKTYLQPLNGT